MPTPSPASDTPRPHPDPDGGAREPAPFPQALVDAFRREPDVPAFEYRSRSVTRAEVLDLVGRCADGLRAAGLGPGRSVALGTDVTPEGFALLIAGYLLGCRVTGLPPKLPPAQLTRVLADEIDTVVVDGSEPHADVPGCAGDTPVLHLGELLAAHPVPRGELVAAGRPDDVAVTTLTSGSTGQPKGCLFTYRAMTHHWSWQPATWGGPVSAFAAGYRRYLLFGTLSSAVMFEHLGLCLFGGGTAVIPEPPLAFPEVLARHAVTASLMTVPRLYGVLDALRAAGPGERPDTGSLRVLLVAGSPLAPHRLAEARELLGPVVHQGYGLTETGMLTLLRPATTADRGAGVLDSVGTVWALSELSVRDEDGREVPVGDTGEVWVRNPHLTSGYWKDEAQTADVLRDGWLRTRDLGHLDGDGFLRLTGRTRDVIIINAILHYAGPIERVLAGHPDVDQAYVVGAPDERTGEAAHAFLVAAPGREPDLPALRELVTSALGAASVPSTFTVVTDVPVGPSGKPDKRALLRGRTDAGADGGPGR